MSTWRYPCAMHTKFPASWPPPGLPTPVPLPTAAPDPFGALVAALHAQTQAIEGLVAINAALLDRLGPVEEPDDDAPPSPMSRKR